MGRRCRSLDGPIQSTDCYGLCSANLHSTHGPSCIHRRSATFSLLTQRQAHGRPGRHAGGLAGLVRQQGPLSEVAPSSFDERTIIRNCANNRTGTTTQPRENLREVASIFNCVVLTCVSVKTSISEGKYRLRRTKAEQRSADVDYELCKNERNRGGIAEPIAPGVDDQSVRNRNLTTYEEEVKKLGLVKVSYRPPHRLAVDVSLRQARKKK